jgi:hypothetical protein
VTFVCTTTSGGEEISIPAHQCILSAASPCFERYFAGPWGREQNQDGIWHTHVPSQLLKGLLTFIYTGEQLETNDLNYTMDLIKVAHEFELKGLVGACETYCCNKISKGSVKDLIQVGHDYEATRLFDACVSFVRNTWVVLLDPQFAALAAERPDVWSRLQNAIDPVEAGGSAEEEAAPVAPAVRHAEEEQAAPVAQGFR